MTKLKCYKCGGELVAKKNHNIAGCQECNSLILLPNYVFDDTKELDEKIKLGILDKYVALKLFIVNI